MLTAPAPGPALMPDPAPAADHASAMEQATAIDASAPTYYRLVQYPGAGFGGLYSQIADARTSIDMEMYELADPTAEHDLVAAARRGVRVRVLLDSDYDAGSVNREAAGDLSGSGVQVRFASTSVIYHIKATTFDGRSSDISTANLTSKYYATTRDAEIVDSNPAQVSAIEATFDRDWAAAGSSQAAVPQAVSAPGLVWSPVTGSQTAQAELVAQIRAARSSVGFESEELSDPAVESALSADARRGVDCRIVMTNSSEWAAAFATLTRAGCHIHVFPDNERALYIHEKLILDDPRAADESLLLGSQNASVASLEYNRELSVRLGRADGGAAAIASAATTFDSDFAQAPAWPSR